MTCSFVHHLLYQLKLFPSFLFLYNVFIDLEINVAFLCTSLPPFFFKRKILVDNVQIQLFSICHKSNSHTSTFCSIPYTFGRDHHDCGGSSFSINRRHQLREKVCPTGVSTLYSSNALLLSPKLAPVLKH